jgi:lipopolysaccharide/colanic/teichoic acid biosynthesis glycosyltransferase
MKRLFDIGFSLVILVLAAPLMLIAALGVALSSPGPVLYRARRVGRGQTAFIMLKFRTMHRGDGGPVITAQTDSRVFGFGRFLRRTKLDELPQFINVLRGDMSVVGPRPEDPAIVRDHYTDWMLDTLGARPGITSPGALFYYARGEGLIEASDPEGSYATRLLPPKLAVERAYQDRATVLSDLGVIGQTALAIFGYPVRLSARDIGAATRWVPLAAFDGLA